MYVYVLVLRPIARHCLDTFTICRVQKCVDIHTIYVHTHTHTHTHTRTCLAMAGVTTVASTMQLPLGSSRFRGIGADRLVKRGPILTYPVWLPVPI